MDTGKPATEVREPFPAETTTALEKVKNGYAPAWIDSDDERITVSLASDNRLRKLRLAEDEDWINGNEYCKRLRQQFQRLYPAPEWANPSPSKKAANRKRGRRSEEDITSDEEPNPDEISLSSDEVSVKPLAALLNSSDSLTQTMISLTHHKLRPELISIQRLKDVGDVQPASSYLPCRDFSGLLINTPVRHNNTILSS